METALKLLKSSAETKLGIIEGYREKLEFAEFKKNKSDIEYYNDQIDDWSKDLKDVNDAIEEIEMYLESKLQTA